MKNILSVYVYSAVIIFDGFFLMLSTGLMLDTIKIVLGITLSIAALFALLASFFCHNKPIQCAYYKVHALTMAIYGVSIMLFFNSWESFLTASAILLFFYAISEVVFCGWLFNIGKKVIYRILVVRFLIGILIVIGVVVAMYFSSFSKEIFGFLFVLIGTNFMLYVPDTKTPATNPTKQI